MEIMSYIIVFLLGTATGMLVFRNNKEKSDFYISEVQNVARQVEKKVRSGRKK